VGTAWWSGYLDSHAVWQRSDRSPNPRDTPAVGQEQKTARVNQRAHGRCARTVVRAAVGVAFGGLVLGIGPGAVAAPVGTPFVPVNAPITWPATVEDGTAQTSTVTIDTAELAKGAELPGGRALTAGRTYLYVALHASYTYATDPTAPFAMPPADATLATPDGTVAGIRGQATSLAIDASWYFPVPAGLTSATLEVAPFSKVLGNERGDFLTWSFSPTPIALVARPVHPAGAASGGTPTSAGATEGGPSSAGTTAHDGGMPLGATLGAGVAGLVLLGAAGASLVSFRRRRAFARADRAGRVVLAGPPPLTAASPLVGAVLAGGALAPERHGILVKLLGPLEVEGTARPVTAGPVLEIIVFLALHPGRTFTSVQLRESIWGLGRQPIASQTFRKYMVELRKAFGRGVVVTDAHRYELTDAVYSDWAVFQALTGLTDAATVPGSAVPAPSGPEASAAEPVAPVSRPVDEYSGRERALSLVRGPVLSGCFDGKKNSPFAWAVGTANDIEDEVTSLAYDLALVFLRTDEPERADRVVALGLGCSDAHLRLRIVGLRVASVRGGPRALDRALDAARVALAGFPGDVAELELAARDLGWVATGSV